MCRCGIARSLQQGPVPSRALVPTKGCCRRQVCHVDATSRLLRRHSPSSPRPAARDCARRPRLLLLAQPRALAAGGAARHPARLLGASPVEAAAGCLAAGAGSEATVRRFVSTCRLSAINSGLLTPLAAAASALSRCGPRRCYSTSWIASGRGWSLSHGPLPAMGLYSGRQ